MALDNPEFCRRRIFALLEREEWEQAKCECHHALAADGNDEFAKTILTSILLRQHRWSEARILRDSAMWPSPTSADSALEIAHIKLRTSGASPALTILGSLAASGGGNALTFLALGKLHLRMGQPGEAERAFHQSQRHDPRIAALKQEFGQSSHLDRAVDLRVASLSVNCECFDFCFSDAFILLAMGYAGRAIRLLTIETRKDAGIKPLRTLIKILELSGRSLEAKQYLFSAIQTFGGQPDVVAELASLLGAWGECNIAIEILRRHLSDNQNNIRLLATLAAMQSLARAADERMTLALMERYEPEALCTYLARGNYYVSLQDYRKAIQIYEQGLVTHSKAAEFYAPLGNALLRVGDLEGATEYLSQAAYFSPDAWATLVGSQNLQAVLPLSDQMRKLSMNPLVPPIKRTRLHFALAKLYDCLGQFQIAHHHLECANSEVSNILPSGHQQHGDVGERAITVFSNVFTRHPHAKPCSPKPIFVCGLPRSGTTLVEQVLASHPDIYGAGELRDMQLIWGRFREFGGEYQSIYDPQAVAAARATYLTRLRVLAPEAQFVVDKTNSNYLYLGLIALMFPDAKIVNVTRDYRDVALSLYFADFEYLWNGFTRRKRPPLEYSFNFDSIVDVIGGYLKVMSHWRAVLPMPIFVIKYEKLITHFEVAVSDMLEFVGVDFHPNIEMFYKTKRVVDNSNAWSVRRPLYEGSIGKWAKYRAFIPKLDKLQSN